MSNNGVEHKPSETALFAALRRTIANQEYQNERFGPDDLAKIFLPLHFRFFLKFKKIRENTKNKLNEFLPGLNEYMIARTAYFDRLFLDALNNQISQIVLLGAGYDTRAYRFMEYNLNTRIFELDSAPTQARKLSCLRKARIDVPEALTFIPINFNTESLKDVLEIAGHKHHKKTLYIWEGVSYYLDAKSVDTTLEFVSNSSHHESAIAFDYTVSVSDEKAENFYGVKEFNQTMKKHHANEELIFSLNVGEIQSYLEQKGLNMVEHLDNEDIERTYLIQENGLRLGQMTGHFRFVVASKKPM